MYVWADGVFLQARMEDHGECMLVLIGATPEGKKELIGFQVGVRESAQSWHELLVETSTRARVLSSMKVVRFFAGVFFASIAKSAGRSPSLAIGGCRLSVTSAIAQPAHRPGAGGLLRKEVATAGVLATTAKAAAPRVSVTWQHPTRAPVCDPRG